MTKRFLSIRPIPALASLTLLALAATATAIVLPPTDPPDEISISAQVRKAYAAADTAGSFLIQRTGSVLQDVTVQYQVSGEAVAGQDYVALKGTRTIAAGQDHATIKVHPLVAAGSAGTVKGVRVTLVAGDGYSLGTAVKATVKIVQ